MASTTASSKQFFSTLSAENMKAADDFYDEKIIFQDPLGEIQGLKSVKDYYAGLYKNVQSIRFEFGNQLQNQDDEVLFWTMYLKTKSLNGGNEFAVEGNSHFTYSPTSHKCIYHRDYFDMGEFIYEKIPVLKSVIHFVKDRLKHNS